MPGARPTLVYISTDYVFRGDKGLYREDKARILRSTSYAWSKLGGECAVRLVPRHLIVRTSFGPDVPPIRRPSWISGRRGRASRTPPARWCRLIAAAHAAPCIGARGAAPSSRLHADSLDPARPIEPLSFKDVTFVAPVDTSLDTTRFGDSFGTGAEDDETAS